MVAAVTSSVALVIAPGARSAPLSSALPPGCAADRAAVAFSSDGSVAHTSGIPVPCAVTTGFGGRETQIKVGPNGDVVEEPAMTSPGLAGTGLIDNAPGPRPEQGNLNTSGITLSQDQGRSWAFLEPGGSQHACCDATLHIDRVTGRLFYSAIFGTAPDLVGQDEPAGESQVMSSPASPSGYTQWTAPTTMYGHLAENPRFTSAPAPTTLTPGITTPVPGENMSYWCANFGYVSSTFRTCYRSFDGGTTWQFASVLFATAPQHPECGTNTESGGYPQGTSDGSLWVMVKCGGVTYLARSIDEAGSFPIVHGPDGTPLTVPGAPAQLRVDTAGNLDAVEKSGSSLLLRVSQDGGHTWSGPLNMTAPAARGTTVGQWAVAVGYQPGQIAVSYLAARSGGGQDGYITVTRDALDAAPVFYASTINPSGTPMVTTTGFGDDFIDVDLGPDGTPWAAFYSDCLKDQAGNYTDPSCAQSGGQAIVGQGEGPAHATTIGRLVWTKKK
jgi:hypothetical protein